MKLEYAITKPADDYCATKELFCGLLCSNRRIAFQDADGKSPETLLLFDGHELKCRVELTNVQTKEVVFHMIVEAQGEEAEQAEILEELDAVVKQLISRVDYQFTVNTLWNDVTAYYGKILYPKISHVENMLRKIIYLFMLKTVGRDWLNTDAPKKFRDDILNVIDKNNQDYAAIRGDWLVYADFISLVHFFTAPYALRSDINALFAELEKYKTVKKSRKNKPLDEDALQKLAEQFKPKSNWDRYFSDKLGVDSPGKFSHDWSSLYGIRNKVAHGRPIGKEDHDKAIALIDMFTAAFEKCISIIDELEITDEQADAVGMVAQKVIQPEPAREWGQIKIDPRFDPARPYGLAKFSDPMADALDTAFKIDSAALPTMQNALNSLSSNISTFAEPYIPAFIDSLGAAVNSTIPNILDRQNLLLHLDQPLYVDRLENAVSIASEFEKTLHALPTDTPDKPKRKAKKEDTPPEKDGGKKENGA